MSRPGVKPVYIKEDLHLKLKIIAAFKNCTITQLIDDALREHLPHIQSLTSELEGKDGK